MEVKSKRADVFHLYDQKKQLKVISQRVGIILFVLFNFLLYCCVRVSAVSNKVVEQLKENQKQMDTDAENQDEQTKEAGFQNRNDNK